MSRNALSEWKCKLVCNFPSVEFFEAKPPLDLWSLGSRGRFYFYVANQIIGSSFSIV